MNAEAHVAAGWILAHLSGGEGRSFRRWVTGAAVVCDVDVLSYIGGGMWYSRLHHALGHNVFFCVGFAIAAGILAKRRRIKMLVFVSVALASHLITDYYLTRFPLEFLWPFSTRGWIHSYRIGLDHPINTFLGYCSIVVFVVMGAVFKRTPMELVAPALDERIVNLLFRRRLLKCHVCGRGANERCEVCDEPVCPKHGKITRKFGVMCREGHG